MFIVLSLLGCSGTTAMTEPAPAPAPVPVAAPRHVSIFGVLPEDMYGDHEPSKELVDLGRMLYYETRLSRAGDLSCNSCHMLDAYGVDGEPTSPGFEGQRGGRNSPTTYNAALHVAQFWDGREPTVEAQAKGPILNPIEMAMPEAPVVENTLRAIPGYVQAFEAAFPDREEAVTYDHLATAIGAFERGLVTKNSKFDRYMSGDASALSEAEVAGLDLFVTTGCISCHSGALLGGTMYQKLGAVHPYETSDKGRGDLTKNVADDYVFKVPSLRNVAETGPYFHDGSIATLGEAVKKMAWHQLGKELTAEEIASIVTFLETLTGEIPTAYVAKPELPAG